MIPFWIYLPMAWPFVLRSRHQAFFLRKCWGYLPMLNDPTCFKQVYIVCGYTCVRSGIDTLTYLICHIYTFSEYDKNSTQSPASSQNRAFPGKLRRNKTMIKILFICHGNMLTWVENPAFIKCFRDLKAFLPTIYQSYMGSEKNFSWKRESMYNIES